MIFKSQRLATCNWMHGKKKVWGVLYLYEGNIVTSVIYWSSLDTVPF